MAGFGARDHPSEGVLHDLWAKALVLQDPGGQRAALVTLDVCGIDRALSLDIRERIKERHGLERAEVVLACSHTHSGPVVGKNLITMYPLDTVQRERVAEYSTRFRDRVVEVVGEAIARNEPVTLAWDVGRCSFAVNRRNNDQAKVPELREQLALTGPDDHDVPVLRVTSQDGAIKAIAFG
jgi:predicted neutral ceramidase superfamily lipid hydrolase